MSTITSEVVAQLSMISKAKGLQPVSDETCERAIKLLTLYTNYLPENPRFIPGPGGRLNIMYRAKNMLSMEVCITSVPTEQIIYHGHMSSAPFLRDIAYHSRGNIGTENLDPDFVEWLELVRKKIEAA